MTYDPEFYEKAKLKREGLNLEKKNWKKAIIFYKTLLTNPLFENDYYIYRRLIIGYDKIKDFNSQYKIIKSFFYSNIYCHGNQVLWMRNKLLKLIERKFTNDEEISEFLEYYKENGFKNKDKSNDPVVIADRIELSKNPYIIKESQYNFNQNKYEWQSKAVGFIIQGKYQEAIETYEEMLKNKFYSYKYYRNLYCLYRDIGDYENAERIINSYYNGESSQTDYSDLRFEYFREELNTLKNKKSEPNDSKVLIVYPDDYYSYSDILIDSKSSINEDNLDSNELMESENALNDENIPDYDFVPEGNYFEELELCDPLKEYDYHKEYVFSYNLKEKYEVSINEPLIYFEYDNKLSEEENIKRKYYLKRYIVELSYKRRYDDAIEILEKLKNNNYFENDWYPYKMLSIIYKKLDNFNEGLTNLKELFYSGIWLNDNHRIFFTNMFKQLEEKMFIDENEILDCFDYYQKHGALNKSKSDSPTFLADKMSSLGRDSFFNIDSEKRFDNKQFEFELQQRALTAEIEWDFVTAADYYIAMIDGGVKKVKVYKWLVNCLEMLDEYEVMFNTLRHFYMRHTNRVVHIYKNWLNEKLELINSNLGTNYTFNDLKS